MSWIDLAKYTLGAISGLISFFIFATIALFFFADKAADNSPRKPKHKSETE
jgi:hypothetical protein